MATWVRRHSAAWLLNFLDFKLKKKITKKIFILKKRKGGTEEEC